MSRSRSSFRKMLPVLLLLVVVLYFSLNHHNGVPVKGNSTNASNLPDASAPPGSLSLVREPDDGNKEVIKLIDGAKKSVDIVMYELQDQQVVNALVRAHSHGVSVRVLLNGGYYGVPDKSQPNKPAYDQLQKHGVPVRYTPRFFALTHQKTLAIDGTTGYVMTYNLQPQYYATSRDFGVIDKDSGDFSAIQTVFNADWQAIKLSQTPAGDDLLWSPGSESATIALINQAKKSIKIYNEEMADKAVVAALGSAAMRGVTVQIVMTDQKSWHSNFGQLKSDGVHVHVFHGETPLYIHAKMILVDGNKAFLGSENFSVTSLQHNRELGIIISDKNIISKLNATFDNDYQTATQW